MEMKPKAKNKRIEVGGAVATPIGDIWAALSDNGLVAIHIGGTEGDFVRELENRFQGEVEAGSDRARAAVEQVMEFLGGDRQVFDLPIDWSVMSEFQRKALKTVLAIPYGETRTYGQIAAQIGVPRAPRAVGRANATNPIPLVIPCHRVLGSDGSLRGYGAGEGIETKQWLLDLEKRNCG
jgi:methylated-DNA-[protein]-cysteine S-methyltransferase